VSLESFEAASDGGAARAVEKMRDASRRTALHFAANQGQAECVGILLDACSTAVDARDEDGATPLIMAVLGKSDGALACVDMLLARGADVNARREREMDSALHIAARHGFVEAVERLVAAGADQAVHSIVGTPLHEAAAEGNVGVVEAVLAALPKPDEWLAAPGSRGATPLVLAAAAGHEEACVALVKAGSPLLHRADAGLTALHLLAAQGMAAAAHAVIERGEAGREAARVANDDGMVPVQMAAAAGHHEVVERLWDASADAVEPTTPIELVEAERARAASEMSSAPASSSAAPAAEVGQEDADAADSFVTPEGETSAEGAATALELKGKGNEHFVAGRFAEAEASYTAAVEADPRNAVFRLNRSAARIKLRNYLGAVADAVVARKIDSTLAKAYYREGTARMALRQFEEAAMAFFEGTRVTETKELKSGFEEAVRRGKEYHQKKQTKQFEEEESRRKHAAAAEGVFRAKLV